MPGRSVQVYDDTGAGGSAAVRRRVVRCRDGVSRCTTGVTGPGAWPRCAANGTAGSSPPALNRRRSGSELRGAPRVQASPEHLVRAAQRCAVSLGAPRPGQMRDGRAAQEQGTESGRVQPQAGAAPARGRSAFGTVRAALQQPAALVPRTETISHIQHEGAAGRVTSSAQRGRKINQAHPQVVTHAGDHELTAVRQGPAQRLVLGRPLATTHPVRSRSPRYPHRLR